MGSELPPLIQALLRPAGYGHPVRKIQLVETHISWVLLTGAYAYKIKKPVNLGFLDFSTLEKRRFYCTEELRLNRRLAPALYLEVLPITGTAVAPVLQGSGACIEYAVKMVQFPETARLDRMLTRHELGPEHIDLLAQELADFHARIDVAKDDQAFGDPDQVREPTQQNFTQIRPWIQTADQAQLRRLEIWSELSFAELRQTFTNRKRAGFVRECHGDAHLANMAWLDERVTLFDCLEFSASLRWIDVMSELAFLVMDLDDRARPDLAWRALNSYLEHTGDYAGLAVFRFYQVYRALVRAKVACIRSSQSGLSEEDKQLARAEYLGYAQLAERYTRPAPTALIITHGFSGSGKSWLAQQLSAQLGAVRLRSDVERKRLHGLALRARSDSNIDGGIYTAAASQRTYEHLTELAQAVLRAGYSVIVDATFLRRTQRTPLRALAQQLRVPFAILDIQVPDKVLRTRLRHRARLKQEVSEADLAVLDHQRAVHEPLSAEEQAAALTVDGETTPIATLVQRLCALTVTE